MKTLNEQEFEEFISSGEKVLVDFYADWCGPCKMMMPMLESAEDSFPGRIAKVNIDTAPEVAAKFGIRSIPTLLVFQEKQVVNKKIGAPRSSLEIFQLLN